MSKCLVSMCIWRRNCRCHIRWVAPAWRRTEVMRHRWRKDHAREMLPLMRRLVAPTCVHTSHLYAQVLIVALYHPHLVPALLMRLWIRLTAVEFCKSAILIEPHSSRYLSSRSLFVVIAAFACTIIHFYFVQNWHDKSFSFEFRGGK